MSERTSTPENGRLAHEDTSAHTDAGLVESHTSSESATDLIEVTANGKWYLRRPADFTDAQFDELRAGMRDWLNGFGRGLQIGRELPDRSSHPREPIVVDAGSGDIVLRRRPWMSDAQWATVREAMDDFYARWVTGVTDPTPSVAERVRLQILSRTSPLLITEVELIAEALGCSVSELLVPVAAGAAS